MADCIFFNGVILTEDPARPVAEALAVEKGRIAAVGSGNDVLHLARAGTRKVDLAGRTLVPGFNDAHAHVWKVGQLLTTVLDLRRVLSIAELKSALRETGAGLPEGAWLLGRGYNEEVLAERRSPTRFDLDAACPDRPVALTRTCGHILVANSRALTVSGVGPSAEPPTGGRIDRDREGVLTGILEESAVGLVTRHVPQPTALEIETMVRAASHHELSCGITSAADCGVRPDVLAVYRDLDRRGQLLHRLNVMPLRRADGETETFPLPERHVSDFLRVDTVKLLADGGLSGATAALSMPYRHAHHSGVHRLERAELLELCRQSEAAGWRLAVHAIGDAAIERVISVFEELDPRRRHRIEHLGLPAPGHLERAQRLGLVAVPQTVFLSSLGPNFRRYLPDPLLARAYPVRAMLDAGLTVALSSDAPVVEDDSPLLGIRAAIERRDAYGGVIAPDQAITAAEALYAYTMGGALASGDAGNRGSMSVGKWADLAVLSDNPLEVEAAALADIRVDMTWVGGKLVFER